MSLPICNQLHTGTIFVPKNKNRKKRALNMTPENSHLIAFCYEDFYQNGFNLSSLCYYQFSQIFKQSLRFSIIYFFNEIFLFNMQQKYKTRAQGGLKKKVFLIFHKIFSQQWLLYGRYLNLAREVNTRQSYHSTHYVKQDKSFQHPHCFRLVDDVWKWRSKDNETKKFTVLRS